MKIILCGYNWSGCEALRRLMHKKNNDIFVYTHKSKYFESDISEYCEMNKIQYSYKKITLTNLPFKPDLIISISYKFKIPIKVLKTSTYPPFNLHPSLLPKYKGCSSIPWAIINNEDYTGYTYHYMNNQFDSGNIILQKKIKIHKFDFQSTLYYRVMFESLTKLDDVIKLAKKKYVGKKQMGRGKYFSRGAPFQGRLNPSWSKDKKNRFIKSMIFPPRPLAKYKKKSIKNIKDLN